MWLVCAGVTLSSDFISGFCGETEDDHQETLSLIREVGYNIGFLFAYSMRKVRLASLICGRPRSVPKTSMLFSNSLLVFSADRKHRPSTACKMMSHRL